MEKLSTVYPSYKVSCYKVAWFTHMLYFIIKKILPYSTLFVVTFKHTSPLGQCYNKIKINSRPFAEKKKIGSMYFHTFFYTCNFFTSELYFLFHLPFATVLLFPFIGTVSTKQLETSLTWKST